MLDFYFQLPAKTRLPAPAPATRPDPRPCCCRVPNLGAKARTCSQSRARSLETSPSRFHQLAWCALSKNHRKPPVAGPSRWAQISSLPACRVIVPLLARGRSAHRSGHCLPNPRAQRPRPSPASSRRPRADPLHPCVPALRTPAQIPTGPPARCPNRAPIWWRIPGSNR